MPRPDDLPKKYHVVMTDGTERDITSVAVTVTANGGARFDNANDELAVFLAPGSWIYIESEARDDRGKR